MQPAITPEQERRYAQLHLDRGLTIKAIAKKVKKRPNDVSNAITRYIASGRRAQSGRKRHQRKAQRRQKSLLTSLLKV